MNEDQVEGEATSRVVNRSQRRPSKRTARRLNVWVRRMHLYAGLFLLPWVFLYGITGAMFNHHTLLSQSDARRLSPESLEDSSLRAFPSAQELAVQVMRQIEKLAPESEFSIDNDHPAEFSNDIVLEVRTGGEKHSVHIDPVMRSTSVVEMVEAKRPDALLEEIKGVRLPTDPYKLANNAVPQIMSQAGLASDGSVHPRGWCKLNFLASIDGQPARVTYVLRDGHVDITKYDGSDGMTTRQFLLRLHTSHGQPPHWNARFLWSLFLDAMAIAMVTWGITGLVMWWQIKRVRRTGAVVIAASLITAMWMYFGMAAFHATTRL